MRTYAEYLATMTVKTLNTICKQAGIKGYSKLRKADLIKGITAMVELAEIEAHKSTVKVIDARSLNLVTGGTDSERSDTYGINMRPKAKPVEIKIVTGEMIRGWQIIAGDMNRAQYAAKPLFSSAPKATEAKQEIAPQEDTETPSLDDLKDAYRNMRKTVAKMGARGAEGIRRVRYVGKLREISAQLKTMGIANPALL